MKHATRFQPHDVTRTDRADGAILQHAELRFDALECLAPLAADVVVTGADREETGLMIFPNIAEMTLLGFATDGSFGAFTCPGLLSEIKARLTRRARDFSASTIRISRAILLVKPPSMAEGESTTKGNLNFRKVLTRCSNLLTRLYSDADPAVIKV